MVFIADLILCGLAIVLSLRFCHLHPVCERASCSDLRILGLLDGRDLRVTLIYSATHVHQQPCHGASLYSLSCALKEYIQ
jgi:hypothetical protein